MKSAARPKMHDHAAEFAALYGASAPAACAYFGLFAPEYSASQIAANCGCEVINLPENFRKLGDLEKLGENALADIYALDDGFYLAKTSIKERISHGVSDGYILDAASFECAKIAARLCEELQRDELNILDMCSAPGGKAISLAKLLSARQISAQLACNEPSNSRRSVLISNLRRCGVKASVYGHDGKLIGRKCPERFDFVLLDAPCSSNAHDFAEQKTTRELKQITRTQLALARSSFAALKNGGVMLYATCSYNECENEAIISALLASEPAAKLAEISSDLAHFSPQSLGIRLRPSVFHRALFFAAIKKQI